MNAVIKLIAKVIRHARFFSNRLINKILWGSNLKLSSKTKIEKDVDLVCNGFIDISESCLIKKGSFLSASVNESKIVIHNNVFINRNSTIVSRNMIEIGENTIIGPNVMIFDHDHRITRNGISHHDFSTERITIGKNCWIGAGAIILRGSTIDDNSIIAAGAIVKGHVEKETIYVCRQNKQTKRISEIN